MSAVPPLEELRPLKEMAAKVGLTTRSAHRWRMHPETPLRAWKCGGGWMTTEAEVQDFVRRRTESALARSLPESELPPPPIVPISRPAPVFSEKRRREIEEANRRCAAAGW